MIPHKRHTYGLFATVAKVVTTVLKAKVPCGWIMENEPHYFAVVQVRSSVTMYKYLIKFAWLHQRADIHSFGLSEVWIELKGTHLHF